MIGCKLGRGESCEECPLYINGDDRFEDGCCFVVLAKSMREINAYGVEVVKSAGAMNG